MRRFLSLLTGLSMLHLMLVGGDLACASHGEGSGLPMTAVAMATMPAAHGTASSGHSAVPSATTQDSAAPTKDCAVPTSTRCCQAMSGCSLTGTINAVERLAMDDLAASGTPNIAKARLESVLSAPEPPPPKA